jgi:hypothetical protein
MKVNPRSVKRVIDVSRRYKPNVDSNLKPAQVVILAVPWPEFNSLNWKKMKERLGQSPMIIDC